MAGSSGIFLKWNNHHESLASLLYSQLEKDNLVDVTLAAEGKFLNAHSLILCASSPYFEELLGQHHNKAAIIILQNVKFCHVQSIIEYIYKGEVSLSEDQLHSFLETAKSLQIKGLNYPDQVQEPTVAVLEMPRRDSIRPAQEAAESADDDQDHQMILETPENLNHQNTLPLDDPDDDVVIVDQPPRPPPDMINLDGSMIEEDEENDQGETENQDSDSISNSSEGDDLINSNSSSDDEERETRRRRPNKDPDSNGMNTAGKKLRESREIFYKCDACGIEYEISTNLERHTQSLPWFRCDQCCSRCAEP